MRAGWRWSRRNWSRLVGPLCGMIIFLSIVRFGMGVRAMLFGFVAFGFCSWLGERHWAKTATPEEKRLDLEDRTKNPP